MEQKNAREIQNALVQPFAPEDLEWRLQTTNKEKTRGLAVPYVTPCDYRRSSCHG